MAARREVVFVVERVVVAACACYERELVADRVGVFGVEARFVLAVVHIVAAPFDPAVVDEIVDEPFVERLQVGRDAHDERRAVGEVMAVHRIERHRVFVAGVVVQSEVGALVEVVEIGHEGDVGTHLVLLVLVVDGGTDGHAQFDVAVETSVADLRTVERAAVQRALAHLVAHRIFVAHAAAETVLGRDLEAPAQLQSVVGGVEPAVGHVHRTRLRQVAEAVVVVVVGFGVHRTVCQHDRRELLVARHGQCRREVQLGFELVVEIEVHEEPFVVGGLAVFEIDLAGDRFVARCDRRNALRHLNRIEPHARRVAQSVGGRQPAHDGAVLVENLRIGAGQSEHLDLPCARDGVAVTDRYRGRVFERLGQIAAGHFAEACERNGFAFEDAVALDVVAAQRALDHDALDVDAFGAEPEVLFGHSVGDADRVVDVAQIGGHEPVVVLDAVNGVGARSRGAGADRGLGPVDRCADERVVVGVGDDAVQFLGRDVRREAQQGEK